MTTVFVPVNILLLRLFWTCVGGRRWQMWVLGGMQVWARAWRAAQVLFTFPTRSIYDLQISKLGVICVRSLSYVGQGLRDPICVLHGREQPGAREPEKS